MPRIRTIKPELPSDKKLAKVSRETRYHFILLWTQADDAGYFRATPRLLLGQLYPHDADLTEADVAEMTGRLDVSGFIEVRETDDGPVGLVLKWKKHQKIDRPSKSHLEPIFAQGSRMSREGASEGVLSPESLVLSPESDNCSAPPVQKGEGDQDDRGELWSLIKTHLYVPDGKPPADWDESRDGSILKALRQKYTTSQLAAAIEGVAVIRDHPGRYADAVSWLVPHAKATLRVLYNTRSGVLPLFSIATQAYWKRVNSRPEDAKKSQPTAMASIVAQQSTPALH